MLVLLFLKCKFVQRAIWSIWKLRIWSEFHRHIIRIPQNLGVAENFAVRMSISVVVFVSYRALAKIGFGGKTTLSLLAERALSFLAEGGLSLLADLLALAERGLPSASLLPSLLSAPLRDILLPLFSSPPFSSPCFVQFRITLVLCQKKTFPKRFTFDPLNPFSAWIFSWASTAFRRISSCQQSSLHQKRPCCRITIAKI